MSQLRTALLCALLFFSWFLIQPAVAHAEVSNGVSVDGGSVVSGTVALRGVAQHPTFRKWQLDLLVDGDASQAHFLEVADSPQSTPGVFTQIDTHSFPNGTHQIRLRVVHSNLNYDEYFAPITIDNSAAVPAAPVEPVAATVEEAPATVAPPANGVTLAATTVDGMVALTGVANHPTFRKWQLDLLIDGDPAQAVFVAVGEQPMSTPGKFAELDTTFYPDGDHQIRLRVVHSNLNYDEYFAPVTFANGNATMTEGVAPAAETVQAFHGLDLSAAPADGVRRIEVDLGDQTLTAWQGDVAVLHTLVSTGRAATPTVRGRYYINTKLPSQRMRGPGYDLPNVPSVMYFYAGYAIHGAYWHNNFGQVMSHGCVNMKLDEAAALYEWASIGTEVYVHD